MSAYTDEFNEKIEKAVAAHKENSVKDKKVQVAKKLSELICYGKAALNFVKNESKVGKDGDFSNAVIMKNKFKNLDQSLKEICQDDNTGLDYDANYQYVYSEIEEYADITDNYFAFCWFMDELN